MGTIQCIVYTVYYTVCTTHTGTNQVYSNAINSNLTV